MLSSPVEVPKLFRDVTLGGNVYLNDTGRRSMQIIVACQNFSNTGRALLNNIKIQVGTLQKWQSTRPDNTIKLRFGKVFRLLYVVSNSPLRQGSMRCTYHNLSAYSIFGM